MAGVTISDGWPATMHGIYTPELWEYTMLTKFYSQTVLGMIANRDYEGEIKQMGDTVNVPKLPDEVGVEDYEIGGGFTITPLIPGKASLVIDKAKSIVIPFLAVEETQAKPKFRPKWVDHSTRVLYIQVDTGLLADIYSSVAASNRGATAGYRSASVNLGAAGAPKEVTPTNITRFFTEMGLVLDERDVPRDGNRWVVIPNWMGMYVKNSPLKAVNVSGDQKSPLRNGYIGELDGFQVLCSNLLDVGKDGDDTVTNVVFGHKEALSFAEQILRSKFTEHPNDHGELYKSLFVYGYEAMIPEGMGHAYVTPGSEA